MALLNKNYIYIYNYSEIADTLWHGDAAETKVRKRRLKIIIIINDVC